jgi:hypothetical protein
MSKREPIGITLDAKSEVAIIQAINYGFDHTDKMVDELLKDAGFNFCQSGRKATPKCRKNKKRQIFQANFKDAKTGGTGWGVVVLTQKKPPEWRKLYHTAGWSRSQVLQDPLAKVPNIEAGKYSWWGTFKDLKKAGGLSSGPCKKKVSSVVYHKRLHSGDLIIENILSYLMTIAPNVEDIALANAAKQMVIRVDNKLGYYKDRWW